MKRLMWLCFCLLTLILNGCIKPNYSTQIGIVKEDRNIQILETIRDEKFYQKSMDAINNGRNIKLDENDIKGLPTYCIQFKDETQNIVVSNYDLWVVKENQEVIFTNHMNPYSYYKIEKEDEDFIRNIILKYHEEK